VVDSPRRPGEVMELWISAEDAKQLETMKRIAETMRIVVDAL
jgi:hypothetical protein